MSVVNGLSAPRVDVPPWVLGEPRLRNGRVVEVGMDATGGGGGAGKSPGDRFTHPVLTVAVMMLLAVGRRALSGWEPLEAVLDPTPDAQLLGDVAQTVLWLAYRGLRKLQLLDLMDW